GDAHRSLPADRLRDGSRRLSRPAAAGARIGRDIARLPTTVRRHAGRCHLDHRGVDLLPGARARPIGGGLALMNSPQKESEMTASTVGVPGSAPVAAGDNRPRRVGGGLLDPKQLWKSLPDALRKLNPMTLWRNPVMFIVEIGSIFTTVPAIIDPTAFAWAMTVSRSLTGLFANLASAVSAPLPKAPAPHSRPRSSH